MSNSDSHKRTHMDQVTPTTFGRKCCIPIVPTFFEIGRIIVKYLPFKYFILFLYPNTREYD